MLFQNLKKQFYKERYFISTLTLTPFFMVTNSRLLFNRLANIGQEMKIANFLDH